MLRIQAKYLEARNEAQKLDLEPILKNFTNKTLRTFCKSCNIQTLALCGDIVQELMVKQVKIALQ